MVFESLGVETSVGLSLKVGKQQYKAANKFFGSCLQSFIFMLFGCGGSDNPNWLWVLCVLGFFDSVFYTSVS